MQKECHTVVYAVDDISENNHANHKFLICAQSAINEGTECELQRISLQNGPIIEGGRNGVFIEHLLVICLDTLKKFQTSKYSCRENAIAITKIEEALMWLNKRTSERVVRGVEGTNEV